MNQIAILYNFAYAMQQTNSLEQIYNLVSSTLIERMKYTIVNIYLFDQEGTLLIKRKTDSKIEEAEIPKEKINYQLIKKEFQPQMPKIYPSWGSEKELQEIFSIDSTIKMLIIFPFITNKHIFGFLVVGKKTDYSFSEGEMNLLEAIAFTTSYSLSNIMIRNELTKHNLKLQEIAKSMRHDFANDIQSIEMTIELLLTTELSDEQNKFIKLLTNAKNSAVKKLKEFKELKEIFEKSVSLSIGVSLN